MIGLPLLALGIAMPQSAPSKLDAYDVVWTSPSEDAAGSMPIGDGEVVLNVWVEKATGDLMFYIARTDALSEISRFLKLGRVRVHFEPSLFRDAKSFKQKLEMRDGSIVISDDANAIVQLHIDPFDHTIHVAGAVNCGPISQFTVSATLENWRDKPRNLPKAEQGSAWSVHDAPFPLEESADVFASTAKDVTWYHRNETSVVPKLLENQSLVGLKGSFDPLLHRTFGGRMFGNEFVRSEGNQVATPAPVKMFELNIATFTAISPTAQSWLNGIRLIRPASFFDSEARTNNWWHQFWDRSWVLVDGDQAGGDIPTNGFPLRKGHDSNGQNLFPGEIVSWNYIKAPLEYAVMIGVADIADPETFSIPEVKADFPLGFTLGAVIKPTALTPGRIFDKLTAGSNDGFLFDTYPGDGLRLIVGDMTLTAPHCFKIGATQRVAATYDPKTGEASIYLDAKRVAHHEPLQGSAVTRGYLLQRYVQACQGRGEYPIKFNGGFYTVEPAAMGKPFNADFRNWGDSHWWQNIRHIYHPMLVSGDLEMMEPMFRMYEAARPLAESRTKAYHGAEGAYFPETMTVFGTYSGGDYGWDRTGHQPKDVLCPWWQYAWNQGPELVALMLDRWDYSRDADFLKKRALPMAESVLKYFDTRFKKDAEGKIILDPTQVVETYWEGVVNDMPSTAGLIAITNRLCSLPGNVVTAKQRTFFTHMKASCPDLPFETRKPPYGRPEERQLAPAQKYNANTSNVENGELYAVWPFRVVSLQNPTYLTEARNAYNNRKNHLDVGWGYDGNVAAWLGMTDEAARILQVKCANSNPAYRWPATWGPNFDWLPDQNHGGNLLNTTNLMLLQAEPLEAGGAIRILPAWPKKWDVDFKLHAPGNTTVHCVAKAGKIVALELEPTARMKNIIWPAGWERPG